MQSQTSFRMSEASFDSETNINYQISQLKIYDKGFNTNIGTINISTPSNIGR